MTRVVIADDSATARQLLRAILEQDGDVHVIAEARDGVEAIDIVEQHRPDLVIMDVHMPMADGLHATKEIMMRAPTPIIIVSSVTQRDVDLSLSATQAGALLALPKPSGPGSPRFAEDAATLRDMVRAMSQVKVVRRWSSSHPAPPRVRRRSAPTQPPELVAMAASTGGPAALRRILMDLPRTFGAPILIVQHIARDFTIGFADWLAGSCELPIEIARHGQELRRGVVYIAPDNAHLGVSRDARVNLSHAPPIGGFRPSATHLFATAASAYGARLAAVVLTGMGADGADGLVEARAAGAFVLAQDEATSVVYGMAAEAVRRGVVDMVLPVEHIAARLNQLVAREAHAG